jgi:hypothetical protein
MNVRGRLNQAGRRSAKSRAFRKIRQPRQNDHASPENQHDESCDYESPYAVAGVVDLLQVHTVD